MNDVEYTQNNYLPYALLEFPIEQIRTDFSLPIGQSYDNVIFYKGNDVKLIFTNEFLDLLRELGIEPHSVLIFHHMPFVDFQRIHIDNRQSQTSDLTFALNWIFCKGLCSTRWFSPKIVNGVPYAGFKTINNAHSAIVDGKRQSSPGYQVTQFDSNMVELAYECFDKGPLLIHANIPHRGVNLSEYDRWSISLRTTHNIPDFNTLCTVFRRYIINERTRT